VESVGGMKPSVISVDPEIMSGTPCIAGTRVPVRTLFDYLDGGHPHSDFLTDFPTVTADQAHQLLAEAEARVLAVAEE
jgi:uncharacterized protein (DUF433 family)